MTRNYQDFSVLICLKSHKKQNNRTNIPEH